MNTQIEDTAYILEKVYGCICFTDQNQYKKLSASLEDVAVLVNGVWFYSVQKGQLKKFDPFNSLTDAQSLLINVFYNLPSLRQTDPLVDMDAFADSIFSQPTYTGRDRMVFILHVSAAMLTNKLLELLKER